MSTQYMTSVESDDLLCIVEGLSWEDAINALYAALCTKADERGFTINCQLQRQIPLLPPHYRRRNPPKGYSQEKATTPPFHELLLQTRRQKKTTRHDRKSL